MRRAITQCRSLDGLKVNTRSPNGVNPTVTLVVSHSRFSRSLARQHAIAHLFDISSRLLRRTLPYARRLISSSSILAAYFASPPPPCARRPVGGGAATGLGRRHRPRWLARRLPVPPFSRRPSPLGGVAFPRGRPCARRRLSRRAAPWRGAGRAPSAWPRPPGRHCPGTNWL